MKQSPGIPQPTFAKYLFKCWILALEKKAPDTVINHGNYVSSWLIVSIRQYTANCVTLNELQGSSDLLLNICKAELVDGGLSSSAHTWAADMLYAHVSAEVLE